MTDIRTYPPPRGVYSSTVAVALYEGRRTVIYLGPNCHSWRVLKVINHELLHVALDQESHEVSEKLDNLCPTQLSIDKWGVPKP